MNVINGFIVIILYSKSILAHINIEELSTLQYEIDILNIPKQSSDYLVENANTVLLSSKFGQKYQCTVDRPKETVKIEESVDLKSIIELLQPIEDGPCLQHNNGWWTFELCYKKFIRQYHQSEDKAIVGDIIYLGYYDSEFEWSASNQKEYSNTYHSQYYINGTLCDLTQEHRKTEIRVRCSDSTEHFEDRISLVEEPLTCRYVVTLDTPRLCAHPYMRHKLEKEKFGIHCNPLLDPHHYQEYVQERDVTTSKSLEDLDDDEVEEEEEDSIDYVSNIVPSEEINMLTKIMVKIGNNAKLNNKNIGDKQVSPDLVNSEGSDTIADTQSSSQNLDSKDARKDIDEDESGNNVLGVTGINADSQISSQKVKGEIESKTSEAKFSSEVESIKQEMDDLLDLDFNNIFTRTVDDILDDKSEAKIADNKQTTLNNLDVKINENTYTQSIEELNENANINFESTNYQKNEEDANKNFIENDVNNLNLEGNSHDSISNVHKDGLENEIDKFPDEVKVFVNEEDKDVEKKHFSYDDLKNGNIQWEAGNEGNQEIFISSSSIKKKPLKNKRKSNYEVTFVPFTVNVMNGNGGEKSIFAVVTRNTIDEHRTKKKMKRIEDNYNFAWKPSRSDETNEVN